MHNNISRAFTVVLMAIYDGDFPVFGLHAQLHAKDRHVNCDNLVILIGSKRTSARLRIADEILLSLSMINHTAVNLQHKHLTPVIFENGTSLFDDDHINHSLINLRCHHDYHLNKHFVSLNHI